MTEVLGMKLVKNTGNTSNITPYFLEGPRGARYKLIRNRRNPEMLFVFNDRPGRFGAVKVKGYTWFRENSDGTVVPVR